MLMILIAKVHWTPIILFEYVKITLDFQVETYSIAD